MSVESRLLPAVALTSGSILVGCGGGSGPSCGSYGSYGSFGSYGSLSEHNPARAAEAARISTLSHTASSKNQANAPNLCNAPAGADGFYQGTLTNKATQQETQVVALIAENGDGTVSGQDGTYYRLNVAQSLSDVSGSFQGYSDEVKFPNGTQSTSGSVTAVVTNSGLSGSLTDQSGDTQTLSLVYDDNYSLASSLAILAGTWSERANGFNLTLTIQTDGSFSGTDSNGCAYHGAFSLIDPNVNAYSENYVLSCNGTNLNFTGLASYFPTSGSAVQTEIKLFADDHTGHYLVADLQ